MTHNLEVQRSSFTFESARPRASDILWQRIVRGHIPLALYAFKRRTQKVRGVDDVAKLFARGGNFKRQSKKAVLYRNLNVQTSSVVISYAFTFVLPQVVALTDSYKIDPVTFL